MSARALGAALLVTLAACGTEPGPTTPASVTPRKAPPMPIPIETRARTLIDELAKHDFAHPKTPFDAKMTKALPDEALADAWARIESDVGAFQKVESATVEGKEKERAVELVCKFERSARIVKISFDGEDHVAGLFVVQPKIEWEPPGYVNADVFEEREVEVGTTPALPGTITMPRKGGPFPAIVLVHGSGPNDRDETILAAKPFKDLAWGLASKGIAVIRYVKRTRFSPEGVVTQKEEVLDGASDAIALLRKTPNVDPKRVFVLGHSQGGYLAPRIGEAHPELAGIVILAGATHPLQDSIIDQVTYLASLDPKNDKLPVMLAAAQAFKKRVEAPSLKADEEVPLPIGGAVKGAYFLDVRKYRPDVVASKLPHRLLVLQGERDYQVTMKELEDWRKALSAKKNASIHTYPALNHLFIAGTGPASPTEYETPGHVDAEVVADISKWILTN